MDLINRLKYYMDSIGVSISQFADNCGIPRPSMSQLLNGRNKRISDDVINKIHAAYPNLSILWLMFGEGEMMVNKNIRTSDTQDGEKSPNFHGQISNDKDVTTSGGHVPQITEQPSDISYADNSLFETPSVDAPDEQNADLAASQKENINFGTHPAAAIPHPHDNTDTRFYHAESTGQESDISSAGRTASPLKSASATQSASSKQTTSTAWRASFSESKVSITPDSGKKITNIVVFYSDNSFQSFLPDV